MGIVSSIQSSYLRPKTNVTHLNECSKNHAQVVTIVMELQNFSTHRIAVTGEWQSNSPHTQSDHSIYTHSYIVSYYNKQKEHVR
jgi:hypothetical protein